MTLIHLATVIDLAQEMDFCHMQYPPCRYGASRAAAARRPTRRGVQAGDGARETMKVIESQGTTQRTRPTAPEQTRDHQSYRHGFYTGLFRKLSPRCSGFKCEARHRRSPEYLYFQGGLAIRQWWAR